MWGLGAGCGLAKGDGALPDPFGCLSVPGFASGVGKCAAFVWGAISLVIGAVMGLVGVRASPDDERAGVGLAVGMGTREGALACWFVVKERMLVVGSGEGMWSADRDDGVLFLLGSTCSPPLVPAFSPSSSPLTSPFSV